MTTFRNRPIRHKLMLITMLTSCLALLLACSAFVIYEQYVYREKLVQRLDTTAGIIGDNCASSISFEDPASAEKSLQSLSHQKTILAAAVYDSEGYLFAEYRHPEAPVAAFPPRAMRNSYQITGKHAEKFRDIELAGEKIGTVFIRHDMAELRMLQRNYLAIASVILLVVSMISWVISSRLQRVVSEPVASLAEVVAHVTRSRDYSVRAAKQSEDELGQLIDGFNEMISQIQQRDAALELARNELEHRVAERTSALARLVSMLNATLESTAEGILAVEFAGEKVTYNSQFGVMWRIPPAVLDRGDHSEFVAVASSQLTNPESFTLKAGELFRSEGIETSEMIEFLDGRVFERHVKPQQVDGRSVGMVFNFRDVTARIQTEAILRDSENFLNSALDALSAHIAIIDEHGIIVKTNAAWDRFARENNQQGDHCGLGDSYLAACDSCTDEAAGEASLVAAGIRSVMSGLTAEFQLEMPCHSPTEQRWFVVRATRFGGTGPVRVVVAHENITARMLAEAKLEKSLRSLLENSRQAGMAEVATSVLHNVGNVLNSVNVASSLLAERLRKSKLTSLSKVADLLRQHEDDLAAFLTADPKGRQLPGFLFKLAAHVSMERESALMELAQLQDHIEHIKDIVNMQQGYAKVSGVTETLLVSELMEDALKLNSSSLARHDITVIRAYQDIPPVTLEKHKVLQILVNLMRNAKQACEEAGPAEKRLTLRISSSEGRVCFTVSDNGIGIAPENLTRIFAHGFTTKQGGHGFGLHGAALAAGEMGGSLTVRSDGTARGATFALELPIR